MPSTSYAQKRTKLLKEIVKGSNLQAQLLRQVRETPVGEAVNISSLREQVRKINAMSKTKREARAEINALVSSRRQLKRKFKKWGITDKDIGKIIKKTSGGVDAERIFKELTNWHSLRGGVELVPTRNAVIFLVGDDYVFHHISRHEFKKPTKFAWVLPTDPPAIIMRKSLWHKKEEYKGLRVYGDSIIDHELEHTKQNALPIVNEILTHKRRTGRVQQLENLQSMAREYSRDIMRELTADLREPGGLNYFRKTYNKMIGDFAKYHTNKNDAILFARNDGGYLKRVYSDVREVIDLVAYSQRAYAINRRGQRVRLFMQDELVNLLTNMREFRKVKQRLPQIIEMKRDTIRKSK